MIESTTAADPRENGWRRHADDLVPFIVAGSTAVATAGVLAWTKPDDFRRFLGPAPPMVATGAAVAAGVWALWFTNRRGFWSPPSRKRLKQGLISATAIAVPMAGAAIAVDLLSGFPEDMNIAFPRSAAFYPTMAVVADVAFHLLPLAAVLGVTGWRFSSKPLLDRRVALVIGIVALVEPAAQAVLGSMHLAFVAPHVAVFGAIQLVLLRWSGYIPMIWFRVLYYTLWHVAWGAIRL